MKTDIITYKYFLLQRDSQNWHLFKKDKSSQSWRKRGKNIK